MQAIQVHCATCEAVENKVPYTPYDSWKRFIEYKVFGFDLHPTFMRKHEEFDMAAYQARMVH